jgi:hypothetical protein
MRGSQEPCRWATERHDACRGTDVPVGSRIKSREHSSLLKSRLAKKVVESESSTPGPDGRKIRRIRMHAGMPKE